MSCGEKFAFFFSRFSSCCVAYSSPFLSPCRSWRGGYPPTKSETEMEKSRSTTVPWPIFPSSSAIHRQMSTCLSFFPSVNCSRRDASTSTFPANNRETFRRDCHLAAADGTFLICASDSYTFRRPTNRTTTMSSTTSRESVTSARVAWSRLPVPVLLPVGGCSRTSPIPDTS